jgi:serralysin
MCQLCGNDQHIDGDAAAIDPGASGQLPGSDTVPGSTATPFSLDIGGVAHGYVNFIGDQDWYSVDLVAGQTYTMALTGIGTDGVHNTLLSLHGPDGTLVASNDDGLPNQNSIITFTASSSGTYYIDAGGYNTGQYGVSIAAGPRATVDVEMGAGIIDASSIGGFEFSWSATPGTGATVTVGFAATSDGTEIGFSQFTAQQITATQAILQYYSEVCGLTFEIVSGYTNDAAILLSNFNDSTAPEGAHAFYPGSTNPSSTAGNVYVNTFFLSTDLGLGGQDFQLLMHELGHSMGLSHPGLYDITQGGTITYGVNAEFIQDTHQYSVMSYFDESNTTTSWGFWPETLMLLDIYALQQVYGANYSTRSGDTVYGFNSNAGGVYNFASNSAPAVCIWDGGGIDTLNLSGYGTSQTISLVAGTFSNIGGLVGNVSIALGAVIENAVGGSSADTIILSSDSVDNQVNGNSGADHVYVSYNSGSGYTLRVGSTASNLVMLGADGADTLLNCEFVHFADGAVVSTASLVGTTPVYHAQSDFNGDGRSDIVFQHTNGQLFQWQMNGLSVTGAGFVGNNADPNWHVVATGDFNGDGRSDTLFQHTDGQVYQWQMNGLSVTGAGFVGNNADPNWQIVATGDFNGDDRSDMLFQHTNGQLYQWQMNGLSVIGAGFVGSNSDPNWQVVATGDFNGDGSSDILFQNTNGQLYQYQMNGLSVTGAGFVGSNSDPGWQVVATGDFNGDGSSDILFQNTNGQLYQYQMDGLSVTGAGFVGSNSDPNWHVAGTGDFNGDGRSDILFQHTNGQLYQYQMNGFSVTGAGFVGNNADPGWQVVL